MKAIAFAVLSGSWLLSMVLVRCFGPASPVSSLALAAGTVWLTYCMLGEVYKKEKR